MQKINHSFVERWAMGIILYSLLVLVLFAIVSDACLANNIAVNNVKIVDQNPVNDTYDIQFDISWNNSWRIAGAPSATANWDAAWVFAKYAVYDNGTAYWGNWAHATLSATDSDHTAPRGATINTGKTDGAGKGIFIYRSSSGTGSVDWDNCKVKWDYGVDSIKDSDKIKVKVFAIEMVYIPEGTLFLNTAASRKMSNEIFNDGGSTTQITSEDALSEGAIRWKKDSDFGGKGNATGIYRGGSYGSDALGASFPKGFAAFYVMKYEISQGQYRDFLNMLTKTQQTTRVEEISTANDYAMTSYPHSTIRNTIRLPSSISASGPVTFGCDYASNGSVGDRVFDQSNDGECIAMSYLSWADLCAYLDWSGLRPMTELEFEKACRGGQPVTTDEFAWGSTDITHAHTLSNAGANNEGVTETGNGLCNYKNFRPGPLRCGFAATSSTNRVQAGAGYYGVMELSGNLWERCVTIADQVPIAHLGSTTSNAGLFNGSHGDGTLDASGNANASTWPGTDAIGAGFRGGGWGSDATYARVSDRSSAAHVVVGRGSDIGGRGTRTSP